MKIVEVSSCFPPSKGGVERIVFNVSKALLARGHDVTVVTTDRGLGTGYSHSKEFGLEVYRYPESRSSLFEVRPAPGVVSHLRRNDFDVAHVHGMTPSVSDLAVIVSAARRKPVALSYHFDAVTNGRIGPLLGLAYSSIVRKAVARASAITALSRKYGLTSPVLRHMMSKVEIVPGGVDNSFFNNGTGNSRDETDDPVILYVGKVIHYKGLEYLVRAFSEVKRRVPTAKLAISGRAGSKSYAKWFRELIDRSPYNNDIWWNNRWDSEEELLKYYKNAAVFALPSVSRREAFGLVVLEAMASGLPAITTTIPGPSDLVSHGSTGLIVPPRDETSLAKSLVCILEDRDLQVAMGQRARERAKHFDWANVTKRHIDIIENLA